MGKISDKRMGSILMVICALLWSISGILIKYLDWNPLMIAGSRSLISGAVVVIYMAACRHKFKLTKKSVCAGVALTGCLICFVAANKLTTAANAIVLQYIAPAFVLILSAVFFHQKMRKVEIGVVAVTFAGIVLFFVDELDMGSILGNLVAILSGFCMSIMFIYNGQIDSMAEKMSGIVLAHALTAIIGILGGMMAGTVVVGSREIVLILVLGIVQLGIPYVLYGMASSKISPLSCSLIGMIEPLLNPVWVAIFYNEIPGIFALIGGVVVIAAVIFYNVWDEKQGA